MNEKEVAEIRRRIKPEKSSISAIRGCYVNEKGEIISEFNQPMALMPEDESEKFLALLKKSLSGTLCKNLMDIEFSTQQVTQGEEHQLLMALRNSKLRDDAAVQAFFQRVASSVVLEHSYVILLAHDTYDVPYRSKDGESQPDASTDVFSYVLCSLCPVKLAKPALSYYVNENEFHSRVADWIVSPPDLGFMFPAFDDRAANIYNVLYYTRDISLIHTDFLDAIFNGDVPMPAAAQKDMFQLVLRNTLAEDCNFDVVQAVHNQIQGMMEEHKESGEEEPLTLSKGTVKMILAGNGVSDEHMAEFDEHFDAGFGAETNLSPRNIVDTKRIEVKTPDVTIHVSPDRSDLVETRIIDGARYILIRADDNVELNGIPIRIS